MILNKWPPEFDGIKIERNALFCRIKETDIWLEFELEWLSWPTKLLPKELHELILAWVELHHS